MLKKELRSVWVGAGALCLLIGTAEMFVLRSWLLLLVVIAVCIFGGVCETLRTILRELERRKKNTEEMT